MREIVPKPVKALVEFATDENEPIDLRLRATAIIVKYTFTPPDTAPAIGQGTYSERADRLLAQVAAGVITLPQAEAALNILLGAGQPVELDEFRRRVETLRAAGLPATRRNGWLNITNVAENSQSPYTIG